MLQCQKRSRPRDNRHLQRHQQRPLTIHFWASTGPFSSKTLVGRVRSLDTQDNDDGVSIKGIRLEYTKTKA